MINSVIQNKKEEERDVRWARLLKPSWDMQVPRDREPRPTPKVVKYDASKIQHQYAKLIQIRMQLSHCFFLARSLVAAVRLCLKVLRDPQKLFSTCSSLYWI